MKWHSKPIGIMWFSFIKPQVAKENTMEVYSMCHPPPFGEEGPAEEQRNLNRLGRWVEALNIILETTQPEMALRIGLSKGALSIATRGHGGTKRETVLALAEKYRLLAQAKGIALPVAWDIFFLGSSWLDIDGGEAIEGSDRVLGNLEFMASVIKERNRLCKENERLKEKHFRRALLAENEALRKEIERLKREEGNS